MHTMHTMHAMVLEANAPIDSDPLQWVECPAPEPGPGQVRISVRCCGICRTDLHVIEGDLPARKLPLIPGHQIVGVVEAAGDGCSRLAVGRRVGVAWLRHTCGQCRFCESGRENLCGDQRFTGYHADGGYAEETVVDEDFAYEIPDAFDDVEAAPLLCAGIVGYRALKRANVPDGGRVAIYGFGSSAHVIAQIVLHRGCELYVVTRGETHRQLARDMGAVWAGESADEMPVRVDSAILFAPSGDLVPPALRKLDKGGTLSLAGVYMTPVPEMDYAECLFHERDVRSVTANTRADGRELLDIAAAIPIRPRTTTYPLQDANRALQDLAADRINGTGVLIVD
jgi:propanol-preferring alcohol dehydrogenase